MKVPSEKIRVPRGRITDEHYAARQRAREALSMEEKISIDAALLLASQQGLQDRVYECLESGADENARDKNLNTGLILVANAKCSYPVTAYVLLNGRADPSLANDKKEVALPVAIARGHLGVAHAIRRYHTSISQEIREAARVAGEHAETAGTWKARKWVRTQILMALDRLRLNL